MRGPKTVSLTGVSFVFVYRPERKGGDGRGVRETSRSERLAPCVKSSSVVTPEALKGKTNYFLDVTSHLTPTSQNYIVSVRREGSKYKIFRV